MILNSYTRNIAARGRLNDALTSCKISRDADSLKNEMTFTYLESGIRASDIVPGALVQGIHEVGEIGKKSDVYVITEVKRTEKKREAVAEEVCHYLLRNCIAKPHSFNSSPWYIVDTELDTYSHPNLYNSTLLDINIPQRTFPQSVYAVSIEEPKRFLDFLKGSEGSIADVTGAQIKLSSLFYSPGIRITIDVTPYSDNIVDYISFNREIRETTIVEKLDPTVRSVLPFWKGADNEQDTIVLGDPAYVGTSFLDCATAIMYDCSQIYSIKPPPIKLTQKAQSYGNRLKRDPSYSIKITDASDYFLYDANFEQVKKTKRLTAGIGDLVKAHLFTGEDIVVRVAASEYDCLEEKYTSITIGEKLDSFSRLLAKDIKGN